MMILLLSFVIMIGEKDDCSVTEEKDDQVEIPWRKLELSNWIRIFTNFGNIPNLKTGQVI